MSDNVVLGVFDRVTDRPAKTGHRAEQRQRESYWKPLPKDAAIETMQLMLLNSGQPIETRQS